MAPNFVFSTGEAFPALYDGAALDHLGTTNFVAVPVELMTFTVD